MRIKKCLHAIYFISFIIAPNIGAQNPNIIWYENYGEEGWQGTYWVEEAGSMDDRGESGFIMVGATGPFGAAYDDIYLIKTNDRGIVEWEQIYGSNLHDIGYCVKQTMDGGYIVCGGIWDIDTYKSNGFLMKTDAYGDTVWTEEYGGSQSESFSEVCQLSDGGYIAVGYIEESGGYYTNIYLVRTDIEGQILWTREYGQTEYIDHAESIQPADDGGFVMCGWVNRIGTGYDVQLVKVASNGIIEWTRYYGGNNYDKGYSVARTVDGGYVIAGYKTVPNGNYHYKYYLIKTSAEGFVEWEQTYGGAVGERALSVRQTLDGGYIMAGHSQSFGQGGNDIYIVKTDGSGNLEWQDVFGDYSDEIGECVRQVSDGNFVVTGHAETFGGAYHDAFLMKFRPGQMGAENEIFELMPENIGLSQNYPNPFNSETVIEFYLNESTDVSVEVFNILGEKIDILLNGSLASGKHLIRWNGSDKSSGIYIYKIISGESEISGKMSLLK